MKMGVRVLAAMLGSCLLLAGACTEPTGDDEPKAAEQPAEASGEAPSDAAEPSRDAQIAELLEVDTSAVPDGPNVDQLFTIDEAAGVCGLQDVFIAVPAG